MKTYVHVNDVAVTGNDTMKTYIAEVLSVDVATGKAEVMILLTGEIINVGHNDIDHCKTRQWRENGWFPKTDR